MRPTAAVRASLLVLAAASVALSCRTEAPETEPAAAVETRPKPPLLFDDLLAGSGIDFVHRGGAEGKLYMLEVMGSGVAAFDCDGDGDQDLLFRQGGAIPWSGVASGATDRLYRNETRPGEALRFVDATPGSGFDRPAYGMGVATGDYDDDGRVDLYLTNYGANRLMRGLGDCRFEDRTAAAGVAEERWSTAASFFDFDRDGHLDLFVANYLRYGKSEHKVCAQASGVPDYCGPDAFDALTPRLFRNRGDGTFEDATVASGLARESGKPLGSVAADFDADGWTDLFVANDSTDNHLWMNRRDGTFEERAKILGAALNSAGLRTGDMGVAAEDFDADGDFDLISTHLSVEGASLWRNDGSGGFWDSAAATGTLAATLGLTGFGVAWFDPDLDSRLDLFVANGGVRFIDRLARQESTRTLEQPNLLLRHADGRYLSANAEAGEALAREAVFRGVAIADFDDDGDPDLVVTANDASPQLLRNGLPATGEWIGLRLVDRGGRRDALGAEARLTLADASVVLRRAHTDGSYLSASDPRVIFGLAGRPAPETLEIRWPDGSAERFAPPPAGRYTTLRQGEGSPATAPAG